MYTIVEKEKEIQEYQGKFNKILKFNTKIFQNRKVGHLGGASCCDLYWSSDFEFWFASTEKTEKGDRFLNWFGFKNPEDNNDLSVNVEISISRHDSRTAGKFINSAGKIFIAHNGDFRKKRKSLKDIFFEHYKNSHNGGIININGENLVIIDELPKDESKYNLFQNNICDFIKEAYRIKESYEIPPIANPQKGSNNKNIIVTQKSTPKKYKLSQEIKHEYLSKAFVFILPSLTKFIGNKLQENDKATWWQNFVLNKLPVDDISHLPKNGTYDEYINNMDILLCFKIITQNWRDIFSNIGGMDSSWVYGLRYTRNDVSHWTIKKSTFYDFELVNHKLDVMKLFMRLIDTSVANQISELKKEFEDKYED
jgi:hypothetical protein